MPPIQAAPPWHAFFATALDGVVVADAAGRCIDVNPAGSELFGRPRAALIGHPWTAFAAPGAATEEFWQRLGSEGQFRGETSIQRPDGSVRFVQFQATAHSLAGDHVVVLRDITDARRTEQMLRQLALIVESSEDAIYSCALDGTITSWNNGAARLFGYAAEQILGRSFLTLVPPERRAESLGILGRIGEGKPVAQFETLRLRGDGRPLQVGLTIAPILGDRAEVRGAVVIARDINQRKALEERLLHAQKMEALGRLTAGIAHDFNNHLTAINGFSEMLLADRTLGGPTAELLRDIRQAGDRATALTSQLLAFSRKQILAPTVFNLNGLVDELVKMLRRLIGADIDLLTRLDPDLGQVRADPGQIDQVLMNLLINARDAMPRGGHLTLETRNVHLAPTDVPAGLRPGEYVQLVVRDTGLGMDAATLERIFEPFFTTKDAGKGTGLGLATVYTIIKQYEGHISAESVPGRGTTFTIYLPRYHGQALARRAGSIDTTPLRGHETVLLVEDAVAVRDVARLGLEQYGYQVIAANDGEEAWATAQRRPGEIHLLLTDVVLPRWNGRQLAERMCRRYPDLHVLYMSGYTGNAILDRGVSAEGVSFLQKPFTPLTLLRRVRQVLDRPRSVA